MTPASRVQNLMKDPKIKADRTHWAHALDKSLLESGPILVLNLTQLFDINRRSHIQRRRNDLTLTRMNRVSAGPWDYVMDTTWYADDELKEKQRQLKITARGEGIAINWSMDENGP